MKNKYVFLGDIDSINLELIFKSFNKIKNKVKYLVIGNIHEAYEYLGKVKNTININEVFDPLNFKELNSNFINFYHIAPFKNKIDNMLAQIKLCNQLCNLTNFDLITLPIKKSIFKKKISFNGMTEFLGEINNKSTSMLMCGEKFSIIPVTTHINLNDVGREFKKKLKIFILNLKKINKKTGFFKNYKNIIFLCFNPHCGENGTIAQEDLILKKAIKNFNAINNYILPADSAFKKIPTKSIYISFYHDQALIPFKILNKKSFNQTLGLNYRRLSPSHGTAEDIKFQDLADNTSYIQCMIN